MIKEYVPFTSSQNSGDIVDKYTITQGLNLDYPGEYTFSENTFENSILNRPQKVLHPGGDKFNDVRSEIKYDYDHNTTSDQVIRWTIGRDGLPYNDNSHSWTYPEGNLSKEKTYDENNQLTITFKNTLGQVILKRLVTNETDPNYDTYYIYDGFGNLRYVLPPELSKLTVFQELDEFAISGAVDFIDYPTSFDSPPEEGQSILYNDQGSVTFKPGFSFQATSSQSFQVINGELSDLYQDFDQLSFQYLYDRNNRMIAKKVPGASWVFMIYDQWDRLVLTQDGNLRAENKYIFTSYDQMNRPIISGLIKDNLGRSIEEIRESIANLSIRSFNTTELALIQNPLTYAVSSTHKSFPYVENSGYSIDKVQQYSYYDNYAFLHSSSSTYDFSTSAAFHSVGTAKGFITGNYTRTSDGSYLLSVSYYDGKGRVIQEVSDHLLGYDRVSYKYSFDGITEKIKKTAPTRWPDQL